eukprot:1544431-Prymnesium_polylepis.1
MSVHAYLTRPMAVNPLRVDSLNAIGLATIRGDLAPRAPRWCALWFGNRCDSRRPKRILYIGFRQRMCAATFVNMLLEP